MGIVQLPRHTLITPDWSAVPRATRFEGPAGTGKSHSARQLAGDPAGVLVLTPTQRQAAGWRALGYNARTAHSYLTYPTTDADGSLKFATKPGVSYDADVVIHDEIGMYSAELVNAHAIAAERSDAAHIYTGDPYQLPPVGEDSGSRMFALPADVERLTDQHRFAAGGRIHDVVYTALEALETGQNATEGIAYRGVDLLDLEAIQAAGAVLMYKHASRTLLNEGYRLRLGLPQDTPVPGDILRVLVRDDLFGLLRGELVTVLEVCGKPYHLDNADDVLDVMVRTETGDEIMIPALLSGLRYWRDHAPSELRHLGTDEYGVIDPWRGHEQVATALALPGVAVAVGWGKFSTVWSSQGLEWDHVILVVDWPDSGATLDIKNKHWYVGASRARSRLDILPYTEPITFREIRKPRRGRAKGTADPNLGKGKHLDRLISVAADRAMDGVATFGRGELAKLLGVPGKQLSKIMQPGVRAGVLGSNSTSTVVYLADWK